MRHATRSRLRSALESRANTIAVKTLGDTGTPRTMKAMSIHTVNSRC